MFKFEERMIMETILLQPSNAFELSLLKEFLQKTHIKSKFLSEEDKEDYALGLMMQETDYNETIDTANFIKKLQVK